jgi:microcystin-dependent protein
MQLNDATRIIDIIDQRIRKATASESRVETTWGTVAAVSTDGRYADLYLYGESAPYASEYFRVPNALTVEVGDSVKAAIDRERGDRWVAEVHTLAVHRKLAVDPVRGQVLLGTGAAAPALGAPGQAIKVNAGGTALEYGDVDIETDPFAPTRVHISATDDLSIGSSTTDPFRVGPASAANIAMDINEIMARNNGGPADLHLNAEGGNVSIGNNVSGNSQGGLTAMGATGGPIPVGGLVMWPTTTAPAGYLLCNGAAVSRTTYERLFAVIGTTFGAGDGSTTFNLPDMEGRFAVGRDPGASGWDAIGETGGATSHTHSDHAALSHSGTAVADHAALSHSGTAVATHADHKHETPFIDNGPQTLSTTQSDFGTGASRTRSWTGSYSSASGSYPVAMTNVENTNLTHSVTQPSSHGVQSHSVTQPSAHAAQSHASADHKPPYLALSFIIKF